KRITQRPDFQENGVFSINLYRSLTSSDRMKLWNETRDAMIAEPYVSDLMGLYVPQGETDFLKSMAERQRTFKMVSFSLSDYPDSEVNAFAAENPDLFRITQLSRITISSSERDAQQVLSSIKDGSLSFEDAVSAHSQDSLAGQGGSMGQRMAYELFVEFADESSREQVLSLARGEYSDVVKTPLGSWAIYRCDEAARPFDASDSSLNSKIRSYLMGYHGGMIEDWVRARAEDFAGLVKNSASFESAAQSRGLSVTTIGPLPLNYGQYRFSGGQSNLFGSTALLPTSTAPELQYAEANEEFWTEAFSIPVHTPSKPLVLNLNVIVLYPESETQAEESSLENIEYLYRGQSQNFIQQDLWTQILSRMLLSNPRYKDQFFQTFNQWVWPAQ
ncbi:MAG: peptidyl-prolyl cis-trans isomerase, partial [Spirochaetaceae bacterium]|nr:peptidyl-prolyl cis-trans isomerase [Spirochaetaceae bacterium]